MSAPGPYYGTHTQPIFQPPPPPPPQFVYNPHSQPLTGEPYHQPQYYSQPHQYHGQPPPPPPPPDQYYPAGAGGVMPPQNTGYQSQVQPQQQRNTGCCESAMQALMCCCAGMLCYMCLCDAMESGLCMEGEGMMDNLVSDD